MSATGTNRAPPSREGVGEGASRRPRSPRRPSPGSRRASSARSRPPASPRSLGVRQVVWTAFRRKANRLGRDDTSRGGVVPDSNLDTKVTHATGRSLLITSFRATDMSATYVALQGEDTDDVKHPDPVTAPAAGHPAPVLHVIQAPPRRVHRGAKKTRVPFFSPVRIPPRGGTRPGGIRPSKHHSRRAFRHRANDRASSAVTSRARPDARFAPRTACSTLPEAVRADSCFSDTVF